MRQFSVRPPRLSDLEAVHQIIAQQNTLDYGSAMVTNAPFALDEAFSNSLTGGVPQFAFPDPFPLSTGSVPGQTAPQTRGGAVNPASGTGFAAPTSLSRRMPAGVPFNPPAKVPLR